MHNSSYYAAVCLGNLMPCYDIARVVALEKAPGAFDLYTLMEIVAEYALVTLKSPNFVKAPKTGVAPFWIIPAKSP